MGLCDRSMKTELIRSFLRLKSVSDIISQCEIIEAAEKATGWRATCHVAVGADVRATTVSLPHHQRTPPPPRWWRPPLHAQPGLAALTATLERGAAGRATGFAGTVPLVAATSVPPATPRAANVSGKGASAGVCDAPSPQEVIPPLPT